MKMRMKHSGVYIFIVLVVIFPPRDYAIKAEIDLEFIFGGPK